MQGDKDTFQEAKTVLTFIKLKTKNSRSFNLKDNIYLISMPVKCLSCRI